MKKLFMFLAVAGLATFGAACSSDDGGTPPPKTLVAKASPSTVKVNENVSFSATADGKAVEGVTFHEGENTLKSTHKFTKAGEYKVVARKQGFTESAAITVTVTEGDVVTPAKTLHVTASASEVNLGEAITFTVKDQDDAEVTGVAFKANGTTIENPWTAAEAGTFEVVASKEGYTSGKVTVKVVRTVSSLTLTILDVNNLTADTGFVAEVKDEEGALVAGAVFHVVGSTTTFDMEDGTVSLNAPAGNYETYATFNGQESNHVTFTVAPGAQPQGTGTVKFGTNTENVISEIFGVSDFYLGEGFGVEYMAEVIVQTRTNSWVVQQVLYVEAVPNAAGDDLEAVLDGPIIAEISEFAIFNGNGQGRLDGLVDQEGNEGTNFAPSFKVNGAGSTETFVNVTDNTGSGTAAGSTMKITYTGDSRIGNFSERNEVQGINGMRKYSAVKNMNTVRAHKPVLTVK